jgi:probable F420-dependent oxidoreductase
VAYGITIPFDRGDVWSSEADGTDAFTPLALAAAWAPSLRLGTAIVPAFTRGPALLAQSAAAMAEAAPGRFSLGLGTSSDVIVESWNDIAFERPYRRVRDALRFLRVALTGARVDEAYDTFAVRGFRLARPPAVVPPILIAALRPGMLHLAGREADGAIINWLAAADVPTVTKEVGADKEIVARIFVCPSEDTDAVRAQARRLIAAYLNVPVYAAFHEWLGRGPQLAGMWAAWKAGDCKAALAAIPDEVVDELVIHGSPAEVRDQVKAYVDNGVTTPVLALIAFGGLDPRQSIRDLAPR